MKVLKAINMELTFSCFRANYLFTTGGKSIKILSAKTTLPRASFAARITYTSTTSWLVVELITISRGTAGGLLKTDVADNTANAILPVISNLSLKEDSILINIIDKAFDNLDIVFEKTHSVDLNGASGAPVSISSLALPYKTRNVCNCHL